MTPGPEHEVTEVLSVADTASAVARIAGEIVAENAGADELAVVGIHTGGVPLAERVVAALEQLGAKAAATGTVDITLYRDDLSQIGPAPIVRATDITFDVAGMTVVLVDDVIFTGRTVRAAIDNLMHSAGLRRNARRRGARPYYRGRLRRRRRPRDNVSLPRRPTLGRRF
jgi:pyrimidine operon attenuation protein/uracil phosphoribosyltransferase